MKIEDFNHKIQLIVRSYDIDSQGIVHNSVYLKYLETGRVEYRKSFGYKLLKTGLFDDGLKVVVVHNSIDYKSFAFIDELLTVFTKISWIKTSSFCFEQLIINDKSKEIICEGRGVLVNLNPDTNLPEPLSQKFINEIKGFEKNLDLKN
jgi:YbgC/YbaW family acyl-CoA thioester hydrolase